MTDKLERYEILEEIGQGGFAIVYRAHDTELDRIVAIKELKPALLENETWVKRFQREAKAIARLDHPRIITIHDVVELGGRMFIVMRLVNGPSLNDYIAARGRIPWTETLGIFSAVAEGLDYAHSHGVLHRDLKPANILIDPDRGAMLTDFGLAKLMSSSSTTVTVTGGIAGTPHYIAPEVWEEQEATTQTDVYAMGCILFEMLTGAKVFKGETPPAVMMAHFRPLELPETWPPGVPWGIAGVLKITLARRPADRYASAGEVARALFALDEAVTPVDAVVPGPVPVGETPPEEGGPPPEPITWHEEAADVFMGVVREKASGLQKKAQKLVDKMARQQAKTWQHEAQQSISVGNVPRAEWAIREWSRVYPDDPELETSRQRLVDKKTELDMLQRHAASWKQEAEQALREGRLESAERAALEWQKLYPDDPELVRFLGTLGQKKSPGSTTAPQSPSDTPVSQEELKKELKDVKDELKREMEKGQKKRKKAGCFRRIIFVGILLLALVGAVFVCSEFTGLLSIDWPKPEIGETVTEDILVPLQLPDTPGAVRLKINFEGGELSIKPGAEDALVSGTATYNVRDLRPVIAVSEDEVEIRHSGSVGKFTGHVEGVVNRWDLMLCQTPQTPMKLEISADGAEGNVELGGLSLTSLYVTQGGSDFFMSFSEPNRESMETLRFAGGASSAVLKGLANANASNIIFSGGAGEYELYFTGELQKDIDVKIEAGLADFVIVVPEGVAARFSGGQDVSLGGKWEDRGDGIYSQPGEGYKITINAAVGAGGVTLRNN